MFLLVTHSRGKMPLEVTVRDSAGEIVTVIVRDSNGGRHVLS